MCLDGHAEPQSEAPTVTAVVFDRAVIVQMLKPGTAKTFEEYAQKVFIPYVVRQLQHVSRLDLVWDSYIADSVNASTRAQRGKGVRTSACFRLGSHTWKLAVSWELIATKWSSSATSPPCLQSPFKKKARNWWSLMGSR